MGQSPIHLGWIPYWNLLPLQHELQRLSGGQFKLQTGHPSVVSRWLSDGTVQLAPASSIAMLKSKQLEMAMPLGIASDGPVMSVYLGLHRGHEDFLGFVRSRQVILREQMLLAQRGYADDARRAAATIWSLAKNDRPALMIPRLKLTTASAASAALSRVLMFLWLGDDAAQHLFARSTMNMSDGDRVLETDDRPMELVIGDEALQRRHEFWKVLDLGQVWQELTGLPFVFGLWQTSSPIIPTSIKALISEAAAMAQARMRVEPQIYFPSTMPLAGDGQPVDLSAYWRVIQYKLSDRHLRSLLLYFALYQQVSSRSDDDATVERFVRWNKVWTASQSLGFQ